MTQAPTLQYDPDDEVMLRALMAAERAGLMRAELMPDGRFEWIALRPCRINEDGVFVEMRI